MSNEPASRKPLRFAIVSAIGLAMVLAIAQWLRDFGDHGAEQAPNTKRLAAEKAEGREILRDIRPEEDQARAKPGRERAKVESPDGKVAKPGFHLERDLIGNETIEVPNGFHIEFDVGTYVVEDGYHIEYDAQGKVRIVENGYGLGPDGEIYEVADGHHLEAGVDGTIWQIPDGYGIGPDDATYELAPGYHLAAGPDGGVWQVAEGYQIGPDGQQYEVLEGYHLQMDADGTVHQMPDDGPREDAPGSVGEVGEGQPAESGGA